MEGTTDTTFAPTMNLTRSMIAQVLYNLEERPEAPGAAGFPDVAAGAWYADAVNWAAARGIVKGYDTGAFGPEDSVTREQLAAILYRYAQAKGYDTTQGGMAVREFSDSASISDWAQEAMSVGGQRAGALRQGERRPGSPGHRDPRRGGPDADELRRARGLNTVPFKEQ